MKTMVITPVGDEKHARAIFRASVTGEDTYAEGATVSAAIAKLSAIVGDDLEWLQDKSDVACYMAVQWLINNKHIIPDRASAEVKNRGVYKVEAYGQGSHFYFDVILKPDEKGQVIESVKLTNEISGLN